MKVIKFTLFLFLIYSCSEVSTKNRLLYKNAVVVSAREEASQIGLEILRMGGNVFDAMVGTEFALSVVYPFAGSIGGGGFAVYRFSDGTHGAIDYREKAPLRATKDMYLDHQGHVIEGKSTSGAFAVAVPGMVKGLLMIHQKHGKLSRQEILKPVIELAKKGYVVTQKQAKTLLKYQSQILKVNGKQTLYSKNYKQGDTIRNLALANTLSKISQLGEVAFYEGEIAEKLIDFMTAYGGILSLEDLKKYEALWREPIVSRYKDLTLISMSPPSSGGVCLSQILQMISPYKLDAHNSLRTIQVVVEACRRAYADRSYYLGDPDFINNHLDQILDSLYLAKRMKNFSFDSASNSKDIGYGKIAAEESNETTHYSIVDTEGNAISVTTTLNGAYGSKLYCEELGFFLNNEMDDFSIKPGYPNMFGLIGSEANSIAPEKRMLSSMTPTILERNGKLWMVLGTPGGSTIITSVLQTILNVYEFGMTMQEAVDAARFHHQWLPDRIILEPNRFPKSLIDKLKNRGYIINEDDSKIIGKVDAIRIHPDGLLEAGADARGDDAAAGF